MRLKISWSKKFACRSWRPSKCCYLLCVPLEEVTEFHQTSGTTGQPLYQPETWEGWEWCAKCWTRILWAMGFRKEDRVFIPFAYDVFIAYWQGHYASEKIGCEVIPGGGMGTEERLLKLKELRPTAFMATPTYALNMAAREQERRCRRYSATHRNAT